MSPTPQELTHDLLDVSVTEKGQFRTCRRRWKLQTLENLTPKVPSPQMPFGTGMHTALEALHRGEGLDEAQTELELWHGVESDRWELDGAPDEVLDELGELADLGSSMLANYLRYDETCPVDLGKVLGIEGQLRPNSGLKQKRPEGYPKSAEVVFHESGRLLVPIVDPETKQPLGKEGPYLSARIDLLTERKTPKKGLWVVDHKTATSASGEEGMEFDDQITGYCYVVWRWLDQIVRGVVLDTLIKKEIKDPRVSEKTGKLSYAKDQLTTADLYRQALKDHGLMDKQGKIGDEKFADCLDALLARGYDPWFRRYESTRNEYQILNYEQRIWEEYRDMEDVRSQESFYPNPQTQPFGVCQGCPVRRICRAIEDGSDWEGIIETEFRVGEDRKAA